MSNIPWKENKWLPGVLNKTQLEALITAKIILNCNQEIGNDASALDLHLSNDGYEMIKGSIKPFNKSYKEILADNAYSKKLVTNSDGNYELRKGTCYIFKILEELHSCIKHYPIYGQATAKSTIGRIDVIARLVVDGMKEYEKFIPGDIDTGEMFIEITPITFNVNVKPKEAISQLRFFYGEIEQSIISDKDFIKSILNLRDDEINTGTLSVDISNTNLDTTGSTKILAAAYRAKEDIPAPIELWGDNKYSPNDFWEPEESQEINSIKSITIKPGSFYILRSKERISLPKGICIYCRAMDETLGEMRIHYAGFVHPFFGLNRVDGKNGTPLIYEVRGHNVPLLLTHEEILARLIFYRMSENAIEVKNEKSKDSIKKKTTTTDPYTNQELTLSKLFKKEWKKLL